jgi:hypothetical protein
MKIRRVLCSLIVLALSMCVLSAAMAECPEGKIEVTVVPGNSGRQFTLCVPESTVDHIGGKRDTVIPATCPCWTIQVLESLETKILNEPYCDDGLNEVSQTISTTIGEIDPPNSTYLDVTFSDPESPESNYCTSVIDGVGFGINNLTFDEALACHFVLTGSGFWDLNCEGP